VQLRILTQVCQLTHLLLLHVSALLRCRYELEAMYFDSSVRAEHYADLADKLAATIAGPFKAQLGLLAAQQLASFDKDFKLALVDSPNKFSAAAQKAAADAVAGFDEGAKDVLVAGTELSGE
jgi:hypothetical protein